MWAYAINRSRLPAAALMLALGAVGGVALVTGRQMSGTYHQTGLAHCLTTSPRSDCEQLLGVFDDRFASLQVLIWPLLLLPALAGVFIGVPLVASEFEAGTHRFWWTQGVSRRRWLIVSAVVATALAALGGGLFSLLAGRWLRVANIVTDQRFGRLYDLQGLLPVASTVLAVAMGLLSGVVFRRTLPAMVTTLTAFIAVRLSIATLVRPRLASPDTASVPMGSPDPVAGAGAWVLSSTTRGADGHVYGFDGSLDVARLAGRCPEIPTTPADHGLPEPAVVQRCLDDLDVRIHYRFHPSERFWDFQLWESLLLVGIAVACLVSAVVILDRRHT